AERLKGKAGHNDEKENATMKTVRSPRDATTALDYTKFSALCIRRFFATPAFSGESALFTRFRYFNDGFRSVDGKKR
ncbi:MAG: hypothetical protein IKY61_00730, partial [Thermoguttaceae bacterium]|nr:hypothetical protein [Thermoguttaceae bacterium]